MCELKTTSTWDWNGYDLQCMIINYLRHEGVEWESYVAAKYLNQDPEKIKTTKTHFRFLSILILFMAIREICSET